MFIADNLAYKICSVAVAFRLRHALHTFKVKALDSGENFCLALVVDFGCERNLATSKQMTVFVLLALFYEDFRHVLIKSLRFFESRK